MDCGAIGWELKGIESQRINLENWISDRANDQHETILELKKICSFMRQTKFLRNLQIGHWK